VEANALRTGKPSATTVSWWHRYDLDLLAARQPEEAVRQLHEKALNRLADRIHSNETDNQKTQPRLDP
jgi:hypothetical protein